MCHCFNHLIVLSKTYQWLQFKLKYKNNKNIQCFLNVSDSSSPVFCSFNLQQTEQLLDPCKCFHSLLPKYIARLTSTLNKWNHFLSDLLFPFYLNFLTTVQFYIRNDFFVHFSIGLLTPRILSHTQDAYLKNQTKETILSKAICKLPEKINFMFIFPLIIMWSPSMKAVMCYYTYFPLPSEELCQS